MRFIGNQQFSFYNVEPPTEGTSIENYDMDTTDIRDAAYAKITGELSASPQSAQKKSWVEKPASDQSDTNDSSLISQYMVVPSKGDFNSRLQEQACSLQQSINDSNVIGNEFNRQEAEAKIEIDFIENDRLI